MPAQCLRTVDTVSQSISRKFSEENAISVHGLLAADVLLDPDDVYSVWAKVFPTADDFHACMPLLWSRKVRSSLPLSTCRLVEKQERKLAADWAAVKQSGLLSYLSWPSQSLLCTSFLEGGMNGARGMVSKPMRKRRKVIGKHERDGQIKEEIEVEETKAKEAYTHAWLLVNTRTFYYVTTDMKKRLPDINDRMALQPIADLFNHTGKDGIGCHVDFEENPAVASSKFTKKKGLECSDGFIVRATRSFATGEQVCISYGCHSDDFLLAEYGFCLRCKDEDQDSEVQDNKSKKGREQTKECKNDWDETCIDEAILPALTLAQKDALEKRGFLGGYMCDGHTPVCYRTEIAARILFLGEESRDWVRIVEGEDDGEISQAQADETVARLLEEWVRQGFRNENGMSRQKDYLGIATLQERWEVIERMVRATVCILRERASSGEKMARK